MKKINRSKKWMIVVAAVMFIIMLVCNLLTDMFADDFHYLYNFETRIERFDSLSDLIPSMQAHAVRMNGRLIAHGLAQIFLMLPPVIFDVLNSLMFVLQTYIIYRIANRRGETNVFLFALVFSGIWLFELAFGQVNLWLVGSCNYLWAAVFCLLFLVPYVDKMIYDRDVKGVFPHILWLILSFIAGAYIENASAGMIFIAFLIGCYMLFVQKKKARWYYIAAPIVAFAGFIWMMSAPYMQIASNEFNLWNMLKSFGRAGNMFYKMWPVVLGFAMLFTMGCFARIDRDKLALSAILVIGGVFSEVIMIFAEYNVERRAFYTFALFLAACALLFVELIRSERYKVMLTGTGVCMLLACLYFVSLGVMDIALTHADVAKNEKLIAHYKENGQMIAVLPDIETRTDYNALTGIRYLSDDPTYWLNACMARYYGVDEIHLAE